MKKLVSLIVLCSCAVLYSACGNTVSNTSLKQTETVQQKQTTKSAEETSAADKSISEATNTKLKIYINGTELTATLADSTAAKELAEKLKAEPVTVKLNEYGGFEKVGKLPWSLTQTDESTVTEAGDIMLYQGNQITIFYNSNSWSYTKLGSIDKITGEELAKLFGEGNITVTLSY
ncbi:hypothetical protein SAMN02910317_02298 [Ruminococcaceae bacterium FB2012]|nr:hypothetical protein SAMN02910317_02298 [Ruminococcaceae bacterium FB2012]